MISRRQFLAGSSALAVAAAVPGYAVAKGASDAEILAMLHARYNAAVQLICEQIAETVYTTGVSDPRCSLAACFGESQAVKTPAPASNLLHLPPPSRPVPTV